MNYLVTGGAGFIGSAVCREIVQNTSASVFNLDKLTYASNLHSLDCISSSDRYSFHRGDVCNSGLLDRLLEENRIDGIIHLAAESHVDRSITGPAAFINTNIVGTYALLEAARAYWEKLDKERRDNFRFLHVSTDEVFGSLGDDGVFTEKTPYDPSSPYSASKAAADHLVMAWHRTYGLPVLMTNCSNNYGPFHFPEKLIPLTITNALFGEQLPVYGTGRNVRDWLYVEDHARALLRVFERGVPGERYNIGGRNEYSTLEVVQLVCTQLDKLKPSKSTGSYADLIEFVADRPGHDFRYAIDPDKIRNELAWTPEETFATGLKKTVQWYLDNEDWWRPLRERIYDGARLGLVQ